MAHDIRLAGPWEYSTSDDKPWIRCQLPWQALADVDSSTVRRKFHRPSGLSESSELQILLFADGSIPVITINGKVIEGSTTQDGSDDAASTENCFDVSAALSEFNTVEVSFGSSSQIRIERAVLRIMD